MCGRDEPRVLNRLGGDLAELGLARTQPEMLNCRSQVAGLQLEKKRSNLEPLQSLHVSTAYLDPESTIQAGGVTGKGLLLQLR